MPYKLIPYASRTGTRSTLSLLEFFGWRLLVSATGMHYTHGFRYAIDNGAWTAFNQKRPFQADKFIEVCKKLGKGADWIVVPDIVEGGLASLDFSLSWLAFVRDHGRHALLAVQDGMEPSTVEGLIGPTLGIFIGGSTEYKLGTMVQWSTYAWMKGAHCHVGRVNSPKRIAICAAASTMSFDGTCPTKFPIHIPKLSAAVEKYRTHRSTELC